MGIRTIGADTKYRIICIILREAAGGVGEVNWQSQGFCVWGPHGETRVAKSVSYPARPFESRVLLSQL